MVLRYSYPFFVFRMICRVYNLLIEMSEWQQKTRSMPAEFHECNTVETDLSL